MYRSRFTAGQLGSLLRQCPAALARLHGSDRYPDLAGLVQFYSIPDGVLVTAEVSGLPHPEEPCSAPVFGFHIHSGDSCTGTADDPFADAQTHYDPEDCPHPHHAGDMPPLFGCGGRAFLAFLTDRFAVDEIVGRTVIIHAHPDDFSSQPAGHAGEKIACGNVIAMDCT